MATKDSPLLSVRNALHRPNSILRNDFQTEHRAAHIRKVFTQNAPPKSFFVSKIYLKKTQYHLALLECTRREN